MIGLEDGTVRLLPYSDEWPQLFEAEKALIASTLGEYILEIEHIGSTAIEGMEAKPILDIAATMRSDKCVDACVELLGSLGYDYKGEYGLPGRQFFVKGTPVTHHLHVVVQGSHHWESWLLFRNYLRAHHDVAGQYANLKKKLAGKYAGNRDAYTKAKGTFIVHAIAGAIDQSSDNVE